MGLFFVVGAGFAFAAVHCFRIALNYGDAATRALARSWMVPPFLDRPPRGYEIWIRSIACAGVVVGIFGFVGCVIAIVSSY